MNRHIRIVHTHCKRCGRPLTTTDRALHGLNVLKAKYGNICEGCTTPDEQHQMLVEIGEAIAGVQRR